MKVLLDEMLPAAVADLLPDHAVTTVKAAGYAGLLNGDLMRGLLPTVMTFSSRLIAISRLSRTSKPAASRWCSFGAAAWRISSRRPRGSGQRSRE